MNKYQAFYKGKTIEVEAETMLEARDKALVQLKTKKRYDIAIVLLPKDGEELTHTDIAALW